MTRSSDDLCLRLIIYGAMFILAFWCAAIAAPIMWRLEYDREHWPSAICNVVEWDCCRISCGKSGCSYQPRWRVSWVLKSGQARTGSYYGKFDVWYKPRENAEDKMFDHPVNSSFPCQYDPNFADGYRYIVEPGQFITESYLIWTIVMYAIGVPLCVLPLIGYLLYLLSKKCSCPKISCDCCRRKRRNYSARTRGIQPPMAYTPPAPPTPAVISPPAPVPEPPRPDPFAHHDVDVPTNPILVPLDKPVDEPKHEEKSGSGSGSGTGSGKGSGSGSGSGSGTNMPTY